MDSPNFCDGQENLKTKGGLGKNGESSGEKIYLQEMWCRIHRNPRGHGNYLLLWATNGNKEID